MKKKKKNEVYIEIQALTKIVHMGVHGEIWNHKKKK